MITRPVSRKTVSARSQRWALRQGFPSSEVQAPDRVAVLRLGVERGMVATLAVVALLLVLLSLPNFTADRRPESSPLSVTSLCLAGLMLAALPLTLLQRTRPARTGLWIPVVAYVGLLALEPFELLDPLPTGSTPWLLGLSLIAFSCTAVAEANPLRAGVICAALNAAVACTYAGRFPASHSLVTFTGLGLIAAALITGVKALRRRAEQADLAEHHAQQLFEAHQRQIATESERVHTDGLLHDTVLATLLAAAAKQSPDRVASMASAALELVTDMGDHPDLQPATVPFSRAVSSAERDLAPFRAIVGIDLTDAHDVNLPPDVANALILATLQALTNSIKHAGASAHRTATATRLEGGGLLITISDDGAGFDTAGVAAERLGVRVCILERVRSVGALATIHSSPGNGTTVSLKWRPASESAAPPRPPGEALLNLVPRQHLYRLLGVIIGGAVLIATTEAVLVTHAYGSVIASILGLLLLPALLRGARLGTMSGRTAWGAAGVSCLLCSIATIGLDAATFDCVSAARYTCGVLAGAVMVWMAGHKSPPIVAVAFLVLQITWWAGPTGAIRLGLAAEIVIVVAGLLMHRALHRVTAAATIAATKQREFTTRQAEIDAFHLERQQRLKHASRTAAPILRHVIDMNGNLDDSSRTECRVLEQALRDEIRGRSLLNDAIRAVVSTQRRRGALVQVLDDGGLAGLPSATRDTLLNEAAHQLEPVRSSRIIIRTGQPESDTAITIVASTPDETAVALGIDSGDEVDLWVTIPRPTPADVAA